MRAYAAIGVRAARGGPGRPNAKPGCGALTRHIVWLSHIHYLARVRIKSDAQQRVPKMHRSIGREGLKVFAYVVKPRGRGPIKAPQAARPEFAR